MSHTPGPWRTKGPSEPIEYDPGGDYAIINYGDAIIAEVFYQIGEYLYADAEANARLIAAAPEMYEALKVVEWIEVDTEYAKFICPFCKQEYSDGHSTDCKRQAAIAKAEGGQ